MEDGPDRGVRTKCRKQRTGRELLRAERTTGQEQRSDRRNGTWFIRCLAESRDRGAICDARERISRCLTVDRAALPACWPLHQGPDVFWQELGKTIAAFGHLERNLASTCISLFVTPDRAKAFLESTSEEAASRWAKRMLRSKVDAMHRLIAELDKVLRGAGPIKDTHLTPG